MFNYNRLSFYWAMAMVASWAATEYLPPIFHNWFSIETQPFFLGLAAIMTALGLVAPPIPKFFNRKQVSKDSKK
jgi:hypothetical protein